MTFSTRNSDCWPKQDPHADVNRDHPTPFLVEAAAKFSWVKCRETIGDHNMVELICSQNVNIHIVMNIGSILDVLELRCSKKYIPSGYFNIAMGNDPFIDGLPIKNGDFPWLC